MLRIPTALSIATSIAAALAVCLAAFLGGHAAGGLTRGQHDNHAGTRGEVLSLLASHYYRRVDPHLLDGRTLSELPSTLRDPYTKVLSPAQVAKRDQNEAGRYAGIGVQLAQRSDGVRIDAVRRGGPAARAAIRPGDLVIGVDGRSSIGSDLDAVAKRLRGPIGSRVAVSLRHRSTVRTITLGRAELALTLVRSRLVRGTGVISLSEFADGAGHKVRAAARRLIARGASRLVLDLRDNPGGYVKEAIRTAGAFLPRGAIVLRESGLHWQPVVLRTQAHPVTPRRPLAVLVNRDSASAAEIVAGALRDHGRALLVGSRTFGKGVVQDVIPLKRGGELKLTIAEDHTPTGTVIQPRGPAPDLAASDDPRTPADDALDRATNALHALARH